MNHSFPFITASKDAGQVLKEGNGNKGLEAREEIQSSLSSVLDISTSWRLPQEPMFGVAFPREQNVILK